MDETESDSELRATDRVERQTVTAKKPVVDVSGQDVRASLDNSCDIQPDCEDGNGNGGSDVLVCENNDNAVDGLTVDDTNCIRDAAEDSFSAAENVAEVSPSVSDEGGLAASNCMESAVQHDTSSFVDGTVEDSANIAMDSDLSFLPDDRSDNMMSYNSSDASPLIKTANEDNADILYNETALNSAEDPAAVEERQASSVDLNSVDVSSDSITPSVTESRDEQLTETTGGDLSQPQNSTEGKCILLLIRSIDSFCCFSF